MNYNFDTRTLLGDGFRFYGEGWEAYVNGSEFRPMASLAWRDGWLDRKMHEKHLSQNKSRTAR